jgi:predicted transcriptional regulator
MRRTTVFLEEGLQRELAALARKRARPAAALVREAIGQYVVAQKAASPTTLSFVAVGGSGRTDTAELHEEMLFKDLDPHGESGAGARRVGRRGVRSAKPRNKSAGRPARR